MFKISELLEVGTIVFNGSTINDIHLNNIEKWKYSGLGKEGIISSLEECTKVKNIILDKILE